MAIEKLSFCMEKARLRTGPAVVSCGVGTLL